MHRSLATIVLSLVTALPVSAQTRNSWGAEGDWAILVDRDVGNGCLMQKDFDDGMRVEFGYVPDRDGGFMSATNAEWNDIEAGTEGIVKIITDDAKFAGDVETIEVDGRRGGWAFFNNPNFAPEIAARRALTVIGPQGRTVEIDLAGTSRAISALRRCQLEQS